MFDNEKTGDTVYSQHCLLKKYKVIYSLLFGENFGMHCEIRNFRKSTKVANYKKELRKFNPP